jgi:D-alanyl-D-alanine carboxypeptidase
MQALTRHLAALSILLSTAACADADATPIPATLQEDVDTILATGAVGVQAEVLRGTRREWAGAGMSDVATHRAVAQGDRFRIASTTKPFVMAVVLSLAEAGKLSLDDTIDRWLPGVVARNGNDGKAMTTRQLLQHRSGLQNHVDDQIAELGEAQSPEEVDAILKRSWTPRELVDLATAHPPHFAPGEGFAYSDTNYVLLGMIIEAAAGATWAAQVDDIVVDALALSDTYAPGSALAIDGPHMRGYASLPGAEAPADLTEINPTSIDAAGALISTPADVNTFLHALLRGAFFGPELVSQMKAAVPVDGEDLAYGLGLGRARLSCGVAYYMHDGDTVGYHTRTAVNEAGSRSVAVAITGDGDFEEATRALVDRVLCEAP